MNPGKLVLRAALVLGLPAVSVLLAAVSYYLLNRTSSAMISSGQRREYLLYVPRSYDRSKPTPLVISMHGGGDGRRIRGTRAGGTGWPTAMGSSSSTLREVVRPRPGP